jgi:hypothetical protein
MRILNTLRPTNHQQRVLAILASTDNPTIASQRLSGSQNLVNARDMLMRLGAVTGTAERAELTDSGRTLAQDSNIIDQSGQLTDVGQQLVGDQSNGSPAMTPGDSMSSPDDMDFDIGGEEFENDPSALGNDLNMESFALLRELLK